MIPLLISVSVSQFMAHVHQVSTAVFPLPVLLGAVVLVPVNHATPALTAVSTRATTRLPTLTGHVVRLAYRCSMYSNVPSFISPDRGRAESILVPSLNSGNVTWR